MSRCIIILGSTGSVGTQALDVLDHLGKDFDVVGLQAHDRLASFRNQIKKYRPKAVLLSNDDHFKKVKEGKSLAVFHGIGQLGKMLDRIKPDIVLNAIAGGAGLDPTIEVVKRGIDLALANKESLVVAGDHVMKTAKRMGAKILPVDSEHSAIWQLLDGKEQYVKKVILTCSGGPFLGKNRKDLERVTAAKALKHPKWSMGPKISIDSATLMNKGLEVIEAAHLFNLKPHQIDVVIHPESIIHSFVEYVDGSIEGELAMPDMRLPIQYALTYPTRVPGQIKKLDLAEVGSLTFGKPDLKTFPCLALAYQALKLGGSAPAVLNTANDVAVAKFLKGKIKYLDISKIAKKALKKYRVIRKPTLRELSMLVEKLKEDLR